jgi:hypothetical protein
VDVCGRQGNHSTFGLMWAIPADKMITREVARDL